MKLWRRSYDVPPPALDVDDERFPGRDPRYAGLADADLPRCESLKDTVARFLPFWHSDIAPDAPRRAAGSSSRPTGTACGRS